MRVLMSTPYDLAVPGGVNRQAFDLMDELGNRGIDVRLVGPSSAGVTTGDGRVHALGRVWTTNRNGAVSRITLDWRVVEPIRRMLREFRPDVLHLHEPVVPLIGPALIAMAPPRVRRVGHFHTYSESSRGYLWSWPWCQWLWSALDARVAVSEVAREFATRHHPMGFVVVPNGIVLGEEVISAGWPQRSDSRIRLLFVGRMDESRKGFGVLVEALRMLERERPGRRQLVAVGRGAEQWRREAAGLPIEFAGELPAAGMEKAWGAADLLVAPSLGGESFGLVVLEAMARGLPVVASHIAGYAAWQDAAVEKFAAGIPAGLAAAIRRLEEEPERRRRLAKAGRWRARKFDLTAIAARWQRIYEFDSRTDSGPPPAGRQGIS